jgi:uncharacterized membrane protein YgcG
MRDTEKVKKWTEQLAIVMSKELDEFFNELFKEKEMSLPLIEQSQAYHGAFDWFNEKLFDGQLPRPMLCLTRNANVIGGYFNKDKWHDEKGNGIHEIAINANMMEQGNVVELMHTLIHEMLHLKQEVVGKPSRHGYHNSEFADWAEAMGLECKDVKTKQRTGHMIATKILDGGKAAKAIALLPDEHIFPWMAVSTRADGGEEGGGGGGGGGTGEGSGRGSRGGDGSEPPRRSGSRSKFTCAICGLNAWAKPGAQLVCGECDKALVETK